jgi:prepilin-type N-terminal cleavage/methylation domain-containing protein
LPSKGFTVLEVLVTIAILALAVLVLTRMQVLSVRGSGFNKESTMAIILAQRVIEDCKGETFGTMPQNCGTTSDGMTVECNADVTGDPPYRSNDITVKVSWGQPAKQISLATTTAER